MPCLRICVCMLMLFAGHVCIAASPSLVFWNNQQASDIAAAISKDFTRTSGIRVDVSWISQADYRTSLLRHAIDRDLPDVALVAGDFLSMQKELDLSPIPADLQDRGLVSNAGASGHFNGVVYGAPVVWGNHLMLLYNRELVKTPARTFAELEQQNLAFRQRGVRTLAMSFGEMYWFVPFLGGFGGWPLTTDGSLSLNTPAMVQALEFYFSLADKGLTQKECRNACIVERFAAGEFAYAIAGDWDYRGLQEKMGNKLGVSTLPAIGKQDLVPMFSSYMLIFPGRALEGPRRAALIRFLKYMQSAPVQRRWAREAHLFPVNEKIFREITARGDANMRASLAQLHRSRAMPNDRAMSFAWEGMAKGFSAMYNGRLKAPAAAELMQNHAERLARRAHD